MRAAVAGKQPSYRRPLHIACAWLSLSQCCKLHLTDNDCSTAPSQLACHCVCHQHRLPHAAGYLCLCSRLLRCSRPRCAHSSRPAQQQPSRTWPTVSATDIGLLLVIRTNHALQELHGRATAPANFAPVLLLWAFARRGTLSV
jgi:hypothetical protein